MNLDFCKPDPESIVFMEPYFVKRSEFVGIESRELALYRNKMKYPETGELVPLTEAEEDYNLNAAKKMGFNKVGCVVVGAVSKGKLHIKVIDGEEEDIIKETSEIISKYSYLYGFNPLSFGLPMFTNNGYRYFNMLEMLPDRFILNGKKPWNISNVFSIMDVFRGTYYISNSLADLAYHFGVEDPREHTIEEISRMFDNTDLVRSHAKQTMEVLVGVYCRMTGKEIVIDTEAKDINDFSNRAKNLLKEIYDDNAISTNVKSELKEKLRDLTDIDEKEKLIDIIYSTYVRTDFFGGDSDNKKVKEEKLSEVEELFNTDFEEKPTVTKKKTNKKYF